MTQKQDVVCVRVTLKPDSLVTVRAWASFISDHRAEALTTLQQEGVAIESVFLETTPEGSSLVYYMRSNSQEAAEAVAAKSVAAIDEYHKAFKRETWLRVDRLELLVDLVWP